MLKELTLKEEHILIMNVQKRKNLNESFNKLIKHYSHKILAESEYWEVITKRALNKPNATACIHRALYKACSVFDCEKEKPLWSIASYFIKKFVKEETETSKGIVKTRQCKYVDGEDIDTYTCHDGCRLRDVLDKLPDCKQRRIKDSTSDVYFQDKQPKTNNIDGGNNADENLEGNYSFNEYLKTDKNKLFLDSKFIRNKLSEIPKQQQSIIMDLVGLNTPNPLSITDIAIKNNMSVNEAGRLKEEAFMRLKENNIKKYDSHFLTL